MSCTQCVEHANIFWIWDYSLFILYLILKGELYIAVLDFRNSVSYVIIKIFFLCFHFDNIQ